MKQQRKQCFHIPSIGIIGNEGGSDGAEDDDDDDNPGKDSDGNRNDDNDTVCSDETLEVLKVYDTLTEEEVLEVETMILEWLEEYMETHISEMSSPKFHEQMVEYAAELLYDDWLQMDICKPENYDDVAEWVEQLTEVFYLQSPYPQRTLHHHELETYVFHRPTIDELESQLKALRNIPQPKQRSMEWYTYRHNLLTASNVWKALSTPAQFNSLVYEKCKPVDTEQMERMSGIGQPGSTNPMYWGIKYEQVSVELYERKYKTKVGEFGCIPHPRYPYLGASPDGINMDMTNPALYGRMIEVKNIVNREITGEPLEHYWIQMQLQMEVCDLDECDFIETRFHEFDDVSDFYAYTGLGLEGEIEKGIILYFSPKWSMENEELKVSTDASGAALQPKYVYMPLDAPTDMLSVERWIQVQRLEQKEYTLYHTSYWRLDEFSCVFVPRNKGWFESVQPKIMECWETILRERETGYEHRAAQKKVKKAHPLLLPEVVVATDGSENEVHYLQNMPEGGNGVKIIKLG